jgi:hypothetical protein
MTAPLFDRQDFAARLLRAIATRDLTYRLAGAASGVSSATISRACRAADTLDVESWLKLERFIDPAGGELIVRAIGAVTIRQAA